MSGIKNKTILTYEESHKLINSQLHKLCSRCGEWLPCTDVYFYKNDKSFDGLFPYCKKCNKQKVKLWQQNNPEKYKTLNDRFNANRSEKTKECFRLHGKKQRESGYTKQYQQNNKDKIKQYNEKYSNKKHTISEKEWDSCKQYFNFQCAYCGILEEEAKQKYGQYFHKEHVDCTGNNDLSNCVPACKGCNSHKWEYNMEEWYKKQDFYSEEKLNKIHKWLNEDYKLYINN